VKAPKSRPSADRPAHVLPWPAVLHGLPPAVLRGFAPRRKVPILIIGNSHSGALRQALDPARDPGVLVVRVASRPGAVYPRLNPPLLARYQPEVAVSIMAGNHHNVFGLLEPPEPFDFIVPEMPETLPGRRIVPVAEVRAVLAAHIEAFVKKLDAMQKAFACPLAHVASPPPVGDETHIKTYPGGFAPRSGLNPEVAPKSVRMKFYLLQNAIVREHCAARGIAFIPAPEAALDAEGFLAAPFRNQDPTHGNARYGRLVLDEIKAFVAHHLPRERRAGARRAASGAPREEPPAASQP